MKVLRLSIQPLPRYAGTARRAFSRFAGFRQLGPAEAENLLFAVGEAIANAIQHARTGEAIEVLASDEGDAVIVRITDRGRGFAAPADSLTALPSVLAEHGRGFAIMQRCTDFFDVVSEPGSGTVVTLGRYRRELEELAPVS
jgi:anti-sigma regulatory factor (Ser/Thr protein kinase)